MKKSFYYISIYQLLHLALNASLICYILKSRYLCMGEVKEMKKLLMKYSGMLAAVAMVFTTLTANTACTWMTYQEELPETAKKLRKF